MPRTAKLKEWIGDTDDQRAPPRIRQRIFDDCGGKCYLCSNVIVGKKWALDHEKALIRLRPVPSCSQAREPGKGRSTSTWPETTVHAQGSREDDMRLRIERRPPEPFDEFVCSICEQPQPTPEWPWSADKQSKAPICGSCTRFWHQMKTRPAGVSRGDLLAIHRLSAITTRLNWESYNGRHGSLKLYAFS